MKKGRVILGLECGCCRNAGRICECVSTFSNILGAGCVGSSHEMCNDVNICETHCRDVLFHTATLCEVFDGGFCFLCSDWHVCMYKLIS